MIGSSNHVLAFSLVRILELLLLVKVIFLASSKRGENQFFGNNFRSKVFPERRMGSQGAMKETIILTNFEFSSTIIGKVSHLSGGFSG